MSADLAVRIVAALAALAVVALPAVAPVVRWCREHAPAVKIDWPRVILAAGLCVLAVSGIPRLPQLAPSSPEVVVAVPSGKLQAAVAEVSKALNSANPVDRAVWAQLWSKAGVVVSGDATDTEVVFTDTRALRAFNILALRIGWRRLGENAAGKYPGLAEATEKAFAAVLGTDSQPATPAIRQAYADLCNALAWCGAGRG